MSKAGFLERENASVHFLPLYLVRTAIILGTFTSRGIFGKDMGVCWFGGYTFRVG